ncbi:unnamed protein product [Leuciscus chuanchicus]
MRKLWIMSIPLSVRRCRETRRECGSCGLCPFLSLYEGAEKREENAEENAEAVDYVHSSLSEGAEKREENAEENAEAVDYVHSSLCPKGESNGGTQIIFIWPSNWFLMFKTPRNLISKSPQRFSAFSGEFNNARDHSAITCVVKLTAE